MARYVLFLAGSRGVVSNTWPSVEWVLQRFHTVDEWLGVEGAAFRRRCWMGPIPQRSIKAWTRFAESHQHLSLAEIGQALATHPSVVQRMSDASAALG